MFGLTNEEMKLLLGVLDSSWGVLMARGDTDGGNKLASITDKIRRGVVADTQIATALSNAVAYESKNLDENSFAHEEDLPDEVILTADDSGYRLTDEFCESVNEFLADKYGYCNGGWSVEIKVSNIDWDTSEQDAYEANLEYDIMRHGE